jgi:hypothetical protein
MPSADYNYMMGPAFARSRESQAYEMQDRCKIIWGDGRYDFHLECEYLPSRPQKRNNFFRWPFSLLGKKLPKYIPCWFCSVRKYDGSSLGPAVAETPACRSPRGAWDHLRRVLCSWALCVEHCRKKGMPMRKALEVAEEIYGGPKKRQAWAPGFSCILN